MTSINLHIGKSESGSYKVGYESGNGTTLRFVGELSQEQFTDLGAYLRDRGVTHVDFTQIFSPEARTNLLKEAKDLLSEGLAKKVEQQIRLFGLNPILKALPVEETDLIYERIEEGMAS